MLGRDAANCRPRSVPCWNEAYERALDLVARWKVAIVDVAAELLVHGALGGEAGRGARGAAPAGRGRDVTRLVEPLQDRTRIGRFVVPPGRRGTDLRGLRGGRGGTLRRAITAP